MRKALVGLAAVAGLLLLGFALLRTPDTDPLAMRAAYASDASQFVELAPGLVVHLRDEGPRDGPALLLIHGSNASLHSWEPWVRILSDRFRLVTLDLQGHGLTGPHPQRCYSRQCMAATVEAVRARLGLERMAVGGNSMGGSVALQYALAHPQRTAALVLVDSAGAQVAAERPPPIGFRIARLPVVRDLAEHVTPRSLVQRSLDQSVSVKAVASEAAVTRYWELLRYPGNRRATLDRFGTPAAPMTKADYAALRAIPVLILWGEEDRLFGPAHAVWFQGMLPQARKIIYPGIGHLPQEEAPERTAADVAAFLSGLDAQDRPEAGRR